MVELLSLFSLCVGYLWGGISTCIPLFLIHNKANSTRSFPQGLLLLSSLVFHHIFDAWKIVRFKYITHIFLYVSLSGSNPLWSAFWSSLHQITHCRKEVGSSRRATYLINPKLIRWLRHKTLWVISSCLCKDRLASLGFTYLQKVSSWIKALLIWPSTYIFIKILLVLLFQTLFHFASSRFIWPWLVFRVSFCCATSLGNPKFLRGKGCRLVLSHSSI